MPLTIAITGGTGTVGSAVTALALSQGHSVLAIDRHPSPPPHCPTSDPKFRYKEVDARDYVELRKTVEEGRCDALVHLSVLFDTHDGKGNMTSSTPQWKIHNENSSMSYNALQVAQDLKINRVVIASSVNAIGMLFSKRPRFDYIPVDEKHPYYPEDAYSLCKQICEAQSDAVSRINPSMRIATLRFHYVARDSMCNAADLDARGPGWKDLWGWCSASGVARACLLCLTLDEAKFPNGHETFHIVAKTTCMQASSRKMLAEKFPEITEDRWRKGWKGEGNEGFIDVSKAKEILGWEEGDVNVWPGGKE